MSARHGKSPTRHTHASATPMRGAGKNHRRAKERGGRRPPRLGRWLLRLALPRGVVAEAIAGDLEQEYRARPRRLRYLGQVTGIALRAARDRLRGRGWSTAAAADDGRSAQGGAAPQPPGRGGLGEALLQDLRFAVRMLVQRPLFTVVAVGTLALGMGINTAIFSVVNGLLLRPVPAVREPGTLVEIAHGTGDDYLDVSWRAFELVRRGSATLDDVAGWDGVTLAYRDAGAGESAVMSGREVTGNYFAVLGVEPALGRFFDPQRFWPDVAAEIVITHHVWQERYDGSDDVLGREVSINGYPTTIVGVAPEGFGGHQVIVQRDVFVPIGLPAPGMLGAAELEAPRDGYLMLLGRLAEGTELEAARQEAAVLGERFAATYGLDEPYHLRVDAYGGIPGSDRAMVTLFFVMLMLIAGMVMAIACVNAANMLLSRALERRRELAIRVSLGAGRNRVVRQLLTESTVLFVLAGGASVLMTAWITDLLVRRFLPQMSSTRLFLDVSPDLRVLAFAFGVALVCSFAFGLAPALAATRAAGCAARGATASVGTARLRGLLVGAQMALACVLLVGAGLLTRALSALESIDLGFDVDGVYAVELDVQHAGYDMLRTRLFYAELLDELRATGGVEAAATARMLPMDTVLRMDGVFPDGIDAPSDDGLRVHFNRVSSDYFRTTGIGLVAGRELSEADDAGAPPVAVINASMAQRLWGRVDVVGRHFTVGRGDAARRYEIVGVAADARYHDFVGQTPDFLYLAAAQSPDTVGHVLVRGELDATIGAVRAALERLDPDVPVVEVTTMRAHVDGFSMGQRLAAWVAGVVGIVGLLLGAVGVYGVTAFAVSRRTREIGVRMALGARAADVRRLMLRRGMRAPLIGMAVGLLLAVAAARLLGSLLHDVSPLDPWTYGTVVLILGGVAALATLLPARRAASLDPVETLRSE